MARTAQPTLGYGAVSWGCAGDPEALHRQTTHTGACGHQALLCGSTRRRRHRSSTAPSPAHARCCTGAAPCHSAQSHEQTPALARGHCWLGEWPQDHGLAHPTASHGAHGCSLPCPTLGLFHSPAPVLGTEVITASLQRLSKPLHCWQHHGSPRLYHMSRMAAPILALMSPYLPGWGVVSITLQLGTVHGMSPSRPGGHAQPERLIPKSLPAQHGCRLGLEPQPERQSSGRRGQE